MKIDFKDQVAIVTGAGNGLGKSHALALAARGAKVVVNDLGGSVDGSGGGATAAEAVVAEIIKNGGEAMAHPANVTNFSQVTDMVEKTVAKWGRVDILINNAGILRDKSFAKMELDNFKLVMDVHLMGSVNCSKAVWALMRKQNYGRIVMTTSSSGMYGNFGQSNYGAAKMAVLGLMNTLVLEGAKNNIRVNALSPTAATRMTEGLIPEEALKLMTVESVTAGLLTLCHRDSPNRQILCAGAGGYATTRLFESDGIYLKPDEQTPENIMARMDAINSTEGQAELAHGGKQTEKFLLKAMAALK